MMDGLGVWCLVAVWGPLGVDWSPCDKTVLQLLILSLYQVLPEQDPPHYLFCNNEVLGMPVVMTRDLIFHCVHEWWPWDRFHEWLGYEDHSAVGACSSWYAVSCLFFFCDGMTSWDDWKTVLNSMWRRGDIPTIPDEGRTFIWADLVFYCVLFPRCPRYLECQLFGWHNKVKSLLQRGR